MWYLLVILAWFIGLYIGYYTAGNWYKKELKKYEIQLEQSKLYDKLREVKKLDSEIDDITDSFIDLLPEVSKFTENPQEGDVCKINKKGYIFIQGSWKMYKTKK